MRTETSVLITGLWRDGERQDRATLRALTGADEALLETSGALPAQRVTALLAATVQSIGKIAVSEEAVRSLTIGDRQRLLFALYEISFGTQIDVVVNCAREECGERIELPLDLAELLAPAHAPASAEHEVTLVAERRTLHVRFRLPNGADQQAAARLAGDLARAGDRLLARCILSVTDAERQPVPVESIIAHLRAPLADAFRALDPAAETTVTFECPACGHQTTANLDAYMLLVAELGRTEQILLDVSRLARAHHWSEADILALPVARRRRYLALLAEGARA